MPTFAEMMTQLEAVGTEQNRKTYTRHNCPAPMFGVSFANLRAFAKKIKVDHELALQLWNSRNHDARMLAMMIADPKQADPNLLDVWVADSRNYGTSDAVTAYVARTAYLRPKAEAWTQSSEHWPSASGWGLMCFVSNTDKTLPDDYFEPYLTQIETTIHQCLNYTRYAMNNALINIGCRNTTLHKRVKQIADTIGEVYVDHGQTGCKTPIIVPYIERVLARKGYVIS